MTPKNLEGLHALPSWRRGRVRDAAHRSLEDEAVPPDAARWLTAAPSLLSDGYLSNVSMIPYQGYLIRWLDRPS